MPKELVPYTTYLNETLTLLADPGLLLVSQGQDGVPNAMAIGWGTVGIIWDKKIFTVLVRPSRYTFSRLAESDSFTVNLPSPALYDAVQFCGTHSGRDCDKFAECGMTTESSLTIATPGIAESPTIYECRIVHTNDVINASLDPQIVADAYPGGNFHRIYYGEILAVRAEENVRALLGLE
ncbi:MAG: flavin reductase family protein [Chloroflexota bacterium]|nr:flavin reductase family protein [Chloroflexota bacterium]